MWPDCKRLLHISQSKTAFPPLLLTPPVSVASDCEHALLRECWVSLASSLTCSQSHACPQPHASPQAHARLQIYVCPHSHACLSTHACTNHMHVYTHTDAHIKPVAAVGLNTHIGVCRRCLIQSEWWEASREGTGQLSGTCRVMRL